MKSLFLVFCGFVLLSSCNSGKKIENDLEKENLKGDVIFTITEGDGQTAMCFDDNGMKTRDIKFNKVSGSFTDVAYFYQNSKLTQSIIKDFSESSLKQTISKFKYDNSGFLISEESDENLRSLKYDSYGLLIEENIRFSANRYYQKTKTNSYYSNKMFIRNL